MKECVNQVSLFPFTPYLLSIGGADLAEVAAIYTFQGWEFPMAVVGLVFWVGWHFVQSAQETNEINRVKAQFKKENAEKAIDRY